MNIKNIITVFALMLVGGSAMAQNAHFTENGTIEYEKTINMYAIMKKRINKDNESYMQPAYDAFRKNQPQFKKLTSTLTFSDNKTLYTPKPDDGPQNFWGAVMVAQNNTTASDLNASTSIIQKKVYEETFLVKDSIRNINWKITDETREIAGFNCRRANALIMDSIYVVAFYTEQIAVSGGPENFSGLPGMILGVALPHENITWFATKVTDVAIPPAKLAAPAKGKAVNNKQLRATLGEAMKDWGQYAKDEYKAFML
ncbi:GLPGLI family protein [Mucilaginibacter aquatilis]|uniref:GLPGLI family protein n=1 Tax=Mucilaginibacter aquatilis TaxID=1517760 RepID=A0A6I4IAT9_9SPHI|nr:GLPGLI family protein [Mucilaginibacter aquatilis]MVN92291.1 GLPGLI family protein [Mucilaginibacter aquatilis]